MQLPHVVRCALVVLSIVSVSACEDLIPTATSEKAGVKTSESIRSNA